MAVPPVGFANQSICKPALAVTVNAGIVVPSQIVGLLGFPAMGTEGQLQFGAVTACCDWQVADEVAFNVILVPAGIWLIKKLPPDPATVPAELLSV